jgi:hypothetical protein
MHSLKIAKLTRRLSARLSWHFYTGRHNVTLTKCAIQMMWKISFLWSEAVLHIRNRHIQTGEDTKEVKFRI